jgi:hypothetical protein
MSIPNIFKPNIFNKRFYLFNETSYVLNSAIETSSNNVSSTIYTALWEIPPSGRQDGTNDDVGVFYGTMRKNSSLNSVKINMLKYNKNTINIDLATLNVSVNNYSLDTALLTYGNYTCNLRSTIPFNNEYVYNDNSPRNGLITLNPNRSFYGKITLTYMTYNSLNVRSNIETTTIYVLPYPILRITHIDNIEPNKKNQTLYTNIQTRTNYVYELSEVLSKNIPIRFSNSNSDYDVGTVFNTSNTNNINISNYIAKILKANLNNVEIVLTKLNESIINNIYFTTTFLSKVDILWGESYDVLLNLSTNLIGLYYVSLKNTTNLHSIKGTSLIIYGNFNFTVNSQIFVGDISFEPNTLIKYETSDALGFISVIKYCGIPIQKILTITDKPETSSRLYVDLTDLSQFRYTTTIIIDNKSLESVFINIQNSGTGIENNTIYITTDEDIVEILPNKKRIFIRILFNPVVWEPSDEFVEE